MSEGNGSEPVAVAQVAASPIALGQVPTLFQVGALRMSDSVERIVLQFSTPQGTSIFFFEPKAAIQMGREIVHQAQTGVSSLIVP